MDSFYFAAYNAAVLPVLRSVFFLGSLVNAKIRRGLKGRRALFGRLESEAAGFSGRSPRFWIHTSSMGEFEQAKPVIAGLRARFPDAFIAVSFFSPSGYENVRSFPGADLLTYIPFDSRRNAGRFLSILRPDAGIVVRHDIWPNHVAELKRRGIPSFLINFSLRSESAYRRSWTKGMLRMCVRPFDHVLAVSEQTADVSERFALASARPEVAGDTRYDQVVRRTENAEAVAGPLRPLKNGRFAIVFGSTWPSDEAVMVPLLKALAAGKRKVWSVWVPHEPTPGHLENVESLCAGAGLRSVRLSGLKSAPADAFDVLLVDRIGILAGLYAAADAAFVGGGFGPGVHSVLEPAAFGIPVFFGPRCRNSYEAGQLESRGGGFLVRDADAFSRALLAMIDDPVLLKKAGASALALVKENLGATDRIIKQLETRVRPRA
jgi:3-deoxy-D-manno-octulosonic-acid transferase